MKLTRNKLQAKEKKIIEIHKNCLNGRNHLREWRKENKRISGKIDWKLSGPGGGQTKKNPNNNQEKTRM